MTALSIDTFRKRLRVMASVMVMNGERPMRILLIVILTMMVVVMMVVVLVA